MSEIEEKNCCNCKYYNSYYVKEKNRFRNTMIGYCRYENFADKNKKKHIAYTPACEMWSSNEELLKETKPNVEKAIYEIAERLNQLVFLLKE